MAVREGAEVTEPYGKIGEPVVVQLEQLRLAASLYLEGELAEYGGKHVVKIVRDFMTNGYALQIRSKFFALKTDHVLPPVPATWWDHFKRDALPTFTRWFGLIVNERREVMRAATIYPDVAQLPGDRYYYREIVPLRLVKDDELDPREGFER